MTTTATTTETGKTKAKNTPAQPNKPTRNAATQLFIMYKKGDLIDLKSFDFKSELDQWLDTEVVEVLRVVRGVEKKIRASSKLTLL